MSKAFTPGPYRMGATPFIVTTDDHVVAMTKVRGFDSNTFADDDTCIANNKFLSAAPDMYEALKVLCDWVADAVEADVGREARGNDLPLAWHKSMAALAKADGAQ